MRIKINIAAWNFLIVGSEKLYSECFFLKSCPQSIAFWKQTFVSIDAATDTCTDLSTSNQIVTSPIS